MVNFPVGRRLADVEYLISRDHVWHYHANGGQVDANWFTVSFDPADPNGDGSLSDAWPAGPALLGKVTKAFSEPLGTTLSTGPTTYYFRTQFDWDGGEAQFDLQTIIDDGAIVYLNGEPLWHFNLPTDGVTADTYASVVVGVAQPVGPIRVDASRLQPGLNVLAVEVHQAPPVTGIPLPPEEISKLRAQPGFTFNWTGTNGEFFDPSAPPPGAVVPECFLVDSP